MRIATPLVAFAAIFMASSALAGSSQKGATEERASTVRAVRIDAHGRRSGLILSDGTELVSLNVDRIAEVAKPGDQVYVAAAPNDKLQLVDRTRGEAVTLGPREVVDLGPFIGPPMGGGPRISEGILEEPKLDDVSALPMLVQDGRVALITHSPTGDPSGFILDDGTQVHMIGRVAGLITGRIHVGDVLHVEGPGATSKDGRGMWAIAISRPTRFVILDLMRNAGGVPELGLGQKVTPPR
jgi:hypothetical protein